jgi:hypothetical protein
MNLNDQFQKFYTQFYDELVIPFEEQCEKRNFVQLLDFLRMLPPPAFYLSALNKISVLSKKDNLKDTFISWAGPLLSPEEKEYIDTVESGIMMARLDRWMGVFRILLKDY